MVSVMVTPRMPVGCILGSMNAPLDWKLNDFAYRSFRDVADGDYISARMAWRARLLSQCLWGAQQTIEKYLKCILLLNRIEAPNVRHDLGAALSKIQASGKPLTLHMSPPTSFTTHPRCYRYQEISHPPWHGIAC